MKPLRVPGTLDSLGTVAAYVKKAAAIAGLDRETTYRLRLAVDEVVTNIATHGYAEAGLEGPVDVWAEISMEALTIWVEDRAMAYDPRQLVAPGNLDRPLEERQMGGLGVYLVLQNVDAFSYERVGDRNRNKFVMYRARDRPD